MAKMIPSIISPKIKSHAERKIFDWFKNDPLTKNWVVLHSLGIENHQTAMFGEIDFLVLASNLGVYALEVKGGRVRREDGVWVYTDKYGEEHKKPRGPFEQASEGMYSVIDELAKKGYKKLSRIIHGYGVMFPDIEYDHEDIDASQNQIFDLRDKEYVGRYIKRLSEYNKSKAIEKKVIVLYPTEEDVNGILQILRNDFDKAVPLKTKIEYSEEHLIQLTKEQYKVIDGLSYNKRCLINGAAGTGKTVLAIKNAKESDLKNKKVALFCYNLLLKNELKIHFQDEEFKPAYIGSFTEFLEEIVKKYTSFDFKSIKNYSQFYSKELPLLAIEALDKHPVLFDKIIIDEAQDILKPDYLDIIDILIKGGLQSGHWFLFGDFKYQTIYNKEINPKYAIELLDKFANYAVFNLTLNCRNTKNIQSEMNKLFLIDDQTLNKDKNAPIVSYIQFENQEDELLLVENELKNLIALGIKKEDITILSPFKFENSVASKIKRYPIDSCFDLTKNITYSTIQGFKGLENKVIVITDITTYNRSDLMYIAMSRARSYLIIFETLSAKKNRLSN